MMTLFGVLQMYLASGFHILIGVMQKVTTTVFDFIQMYWPLGFYASVYDCQEPCRWWWRLYLTSYRWTYLQVFTLLFKICRSHANGDDGCIWLHADVLTSWFLHSFLWFAGAMQMVMTAVFGFIQMYLPLGFYTPVDREGKPPNFWRNMLLVGTMRWGLIRTSVSCFHKMGPRLIPACWGCWY